MGRSSSASIILLLQATVTGVIGDPTCGYRACPKTDPNKLTVHLVPHTHDDVGWVKTVDEYYHGELGVQTIFESVIKQLVLDPSRKFIWVETAFLWKWWSGQQNESLKQVVRDLVREGQLEVTGGRYHGSFILNPEKI